MRCAECKYWGVDGNDYDALHGTKRCGKAVQMWDASEWGDTDEDGYARILLPQFEGQMMFVKDGSDYRADLYTKPGFFCAHFES